MIKLLSIADCISLTNAIFGFLSIIMIFLKETRFAFSLILLALIADGLDGIVARKTRKGELGEYMEAMADMISLGVAPAFFVYFTYHEILSNNLFEQILVISILVIYLIMSIIRLASFHIIKEEKFFIGLPASASTIFIIVTCIFKIDLTYIIILILILSFAMISPIKFPKIGLKINSLAAVLIFATIIFKDMYNNIVPLILFIAIGLYVLFGPIYLKKTESYVKEI